MNYADYIRLLLAPVGIYDLSPTSLSGGEIESIGAALDACAQNLEVLEREAIVPTAQDYGLSMREALFASCGASPTLELRRIAIAALGKIGNGDFSPAAIDSSLSGCGIAARVEEKETYGQVRVFFPQNLGVPHNFAVISHIINDIIPCHLETEFYFRYLLWSELESLYATFADIDRASLTWEQFQVTLEK